MLTDPWPWWLAAVVLTAVSLLHFRLVGRLMGGSGAWISLVNVREERRAQHEEEGFVDDPAALEAAMLEATLAQFGPGAAALPETPPPADDPAPAPEPTERPLGRSPWTAHLAFVIALALGGTLASLLRTGRLSLHLTLGEAFERLYGSGPLGLGVLLAGGLLVGFGVRMAGGCTVGHGLNGCSRLQRGSLATTIVFFATGIATAKLVGVLAGAP